LKREKYPEAAFIELEPSSKDTDELALDGHTQKKLRRIERETIEQMLSDLRLDEEKPSPAR